MNIAEIAQTRVDATTKGMPPHIPALALAEIGRQGWNVLRQDLPLPLLVLKADALAGNRKWMRHFLKETGVDLAPHGKTTMCPQIFRQQLEDGAWGITCATVEQLQVYRRFGVTRVMFANQLVGRQATLFVLDEIARDPEFEFYAFVDSVAGAKLLAEAASARRLPRPLRLLVEVGQHAARTGARTADEAMAIARTISQAAPALALCGVASYEGMVSGGNDAGMTPNVGKMFDLHAAVAKACVEAKLFAPGFPVVFTAGGSQFPDIAARRLAGISIGRPTNVIVRAGCYITHDSVHYTETLAHLRERDPALDSNALSLRPALELWAMVQSRPEPGIAFAAFGKRDTGFDMGLPRPECWLRPGKDATPQPLPAGSYKVARLNDQHAHLEIPTDSPLAIGDMLSFGISHPCTTFDKWQVIPVVDAQYDVVDAYRTYF